MISRGTKDHRQSQLLDDAADPGADGAAGRGRIERLVVDTYQSVSGTGAKPSPSWRARFAPTWRRAEQAIVYPHPIAFNALPEIDVFLDNGYTKEEWKIVTESRKILHLPELRISCTAVRAGVRGALGSGPRRDDRALTRIALRRLFGAVAGVVSRRPASHEYPLASNAAGAMNLRGPRSPGPVRAGRAGIAFWVVSRQPPQGGGDQCRRACRGARGPWLGPGAARRGAVARPVGRPRDLGEATTGQASALGATTDERPRSAGRLEMDRREVRVCTRCRLAETRTKAVPGMAARTTEVILVVRPGQTEDQQGGRSSAARSTFS